MWKRLLIGVAVAEVVIMALLISQASRIDERVRISEEESPVRLASSGANRAGGYSFRFPERWNVDYKGSVTRIQNPMRNVVVAMGTAPSVDLLDLSDEVVAQLGEAYPQVRVASRDVMNVNGLLSLMTRGRLVNGEGAPLRFFALSIEGPRNTNYALTAFLAAEAGSDRTRQEIQQVLASFRTSSS